MVTYQGNCKKEDLMGAKVTFVKQSLVQEVPTGCDFQRALALYPHLPLRFGCRRGECGVCAFRVVQGMKNLTKRTPEEVKTLARKELSDEWRLGCQCCLNGDIAIEPLNEQ